VSECANPSECDIIHVHCIKEENLGSSPLVEFLRRSPQYSAVLGTGREAFILSENLYKELKSRGVDCLELPTQNVVFVGAFSRKAQRVRKRVYLTLQFGDLHTEQVLLVSAQLLTPMLIGSDFCIAYDNILDFERGKIVLHSNDKSTGIEIVCGRQEGREGEGYYQPLSNKLIIALPTPLRDPSQAAVVHLSHPLSAPSCEGCPTFPEPGR
jgi:hypothetical protein